MYSTPNTNDKLLLSTRADSWSAFEEQGFQSELEDELDDELEKKPHHKSQDLDRGNSKNDHSDGVEQDITHVQNNGVGIDAQSERKEDLEIEVNEISESEVNHISEGELKKTFMDGPKDGPKESIGRNLISNLAEDPYHAPEDNGEDELEDEHVAETDHHFEVQSADGSQMDGDSRTHQGSFAQPHTLDSDEESDDDIEPLDVSDEEMLITHVLQSPHTQSGNANSAHKAPFADGEEVEVELQDSPSTTSNGKTEAVPEIVTVSDSDSDSSLSSIDQSPVPIIITVMGSDFLLLPFNEGSECPDMSHLVSLFEEDGIEECSIEQLFIRLRQQEELRELQFFDEAKELRLELPQLNMSITEDNVYSREVTLADFTLTFRKLRRNTIETARPSSFELVISTQIRFITQFNNLAQSIRKGTGFEQAKRLLDVQETENAVKRQKS